MTFGFGSGPQLGQKWKDILATAAKSSERVNVQAWLARCTLDVIGEGVLWSWSLFGLRADDRSVGFDIQCGALDDSLNPVMEAYKNRL